MLRHTLSALLVALVLAGCGGATATTVAEIPATATIETCRDTTMNYDDTLKPVLAKWDDAVKIVGSTSRVALAPQISALQTIKREADALKPGACVEPTHALILQSMNATIDGYLAFSAQKSDAEVQRFLVGAKLDYDLALTQINDLSRGLDIADAAPVATVAEIVERYKSAGYPMAQRPLSSGGNAWGGVYKGTMIEVVSYADGVLKSVFVGDDGSKPIDASTLASTIQIAAPEWADAEAWISARMDTKPDQTLVIGRNIATLSTFIDRKTLTVVFH